MKGRSETNGLPALAWMRFSLAVLGMALLAFAARAEIYSWTDGQGIRHFSDAPPREAAEVRVRQEIPHDETAAGRQDEAHRQMMEDLAVQQQMEKEAAEKEALKKRLDEAERKSMEAEKKAEAALKAAAEAQAAASEKQRYREIYILPEGAIAPYPRKKSGFYPSGSHSNSGISGF